MVAKASGWYRIVKCLDLVEVSFAGSGYLGDIQPLNLLETQYWPVAIIQIKNRTFSLKVLNIKTPPRFVHTRSRKPKKLNSIYWITNNFTLFIPSDQYSHIPFSRNYENIAIKCKLSEINKSLIHEMLFCFRNNQLWQYDLKHLFLSRNQL